MRAGVARADDRAAVAPHLHPHLPRLVVVGPAREAESGHEVVGDDDVAQRVELVDAARLGDLGYRLAFPLLVLGGKGFVDHVDGPVRDLEAGRRLERGLAQHVTPVGRCEHGQLLGVGERHRLLPARDAVEEEAAVEAQARQRGERHGQRDDARAMLGRVVGRGEVVLRDRLASFADEQHVPVDRAIRGERHARQQPRREILEQAHARYELECGSRVVPHDSAKREDLLLARVARRHHVAGRVVVRPGRGKARVEQRAHCVEVGGGRLTLGRAIPHRYAANRRVTDKEAGVRRERAVDAVEIFAEGPPVPRHSRSERSERHALDPGEHAHQVVPVVGTERRDREAAVAADDGRHAVQWGRRQRRVPEHLGVVMRMDVDEAGCDDLALGVDRVRRLLVDLADRRDPAVADSDVGDPAGRPRTVDDRATADDHVEHDPTIVQQPWVTHLRVGWRSSPGRLVGSARQSRAGSRPRGPASRSSPGASNRDPAGTSRGRCARRPTPYPPPEAWPWRSSPTSPTRVATGPRSWSARPRSSARSTCSSTTRRPAST